VDLVGEAKELATSDQYVLCPHGPRPGTYLVDPKGPEPSLPHAGGGGRRAGVAD
jgi:hypothetical protein